MKNNFYNQIKKDFIVAEEFNRTLRATMLNIIESLDNSTYIRNLTNEQMHIYREHFNNTVKLRIQLEKYLRTLDESKNILDFFNCESLYEEIIIWKKQRRNKRKITNK